MNVRVKQWCWKKKIANHIICAVAFTLANWMSMVSLFSNKFLHSAWSVEYDLLNCERAKKIARKKYLLWLTLLPNQNTKLALVSVFSLKIPPSYDVALVMFHFLHSLIIIDNIQRCINELIVLEIWLEKKWKKPLFQLKIIINQKSIVEAYQKVFDD